MMIDDELTRVEQIALYAVRRREVRRRYDIRGNSLNVPPNISAKTILALEAKKMVKEARNPHKRLAMSPVVYFELTPAAEKLLPATFDGTFHVYRNAAGPRGAVKWELASVHDRYDRAEVAALSLLSERRIHTEPRNGLVRGFFGNEGSSRWYAMISVKPLVTPTEPEPVIVNENKQIVDDANDMARLFYEAMGYQASEGYRFDRATHPQEKLCWELAGIAFEALLGTPIDDALSALEEEVE